MGKSRRLRLGDVRKAYRLVGECRELGSDVLAWRTHFADGLRPLVGAQIALAGEAHLPMAEAPVEFLADAEVGWPSAAARARVMDYIRDRRCLHDPFIQQLARLPGRLVTSSPPRLLGQRAWEESVAYNEYLKPSGVGPGLFSQWTLVAGKVFCPLSVFRPCGEREFGSRERRLVHLLHEEVGLLIGTALASGREPGLAGLSPRQRQTLACLLEGDTEKQAAARLGVSGATLHQYVMGLYRHFGVSSRGELLAYFLRRFRGAKTATPPRVGE